MENVPNGGGDDDPETRGSIYCPSCGSLQPIEEIMKVCEDMSPIINNQID